jgi:hypothetical protein
VRRGVIIFACLAAGLTAVAPATAAAPLRTAIVDPIEFGRADAAPAMARARNAGTTVVRLVLTWRSVAPPDLPASWDPQNPCDPNYHWAWFDKQVEAAAAAGLDPLVVIQYAPSWAEGAGSGPDGAVRPSAAKLGQFARAAALRYNGNFDLNECNPDPYAEPHRLPRVRYWQVWNEPNRDYFLMPQYEGGRLVSAAHYRAMVNSVARAVHNVDPTNLVVAGGLAPLGRPGKPGPMPFMRAFLSAPAEFDVWAHHPYTSGGPTHTAPTRNDISLGDLPEMRALLRQQVAAGRVVSSRTVGFWVTEFSWDSSPPDPRGVPSTIHARWVSEALYRMWKSGVSLVTWHRLRDDPLRTSHYQSGLWTVSWKPKRALQAFRFPVVAFAGRSGIQIWGRTPAGVPARVVLEVKVGSGWRQLGRISTNSVGIFAKTYRTPIRKGYVRGRFAGGISVPFSLTPVRDRYVNPFGCGGVIPC